MSDTSKCCPQCGAPLPDDAPRGLCPKCLLAGVMRGTETGAPVTTPVPKPAAPTVEQLAPCFPNLELLELIGQGGMGYVYKARQPQLDRLVALKILPSTLAGDPSFAERFSREGKLLAKLNHANIVTVHDFGVAEPAAPGASEETLATQPDEVSIRPRVSQRHYFLLMEYMDGVNLRQAMRAGRFTPEQALSVVPKVCEALQYAHDEGVLHRDIKPENILVDARGRVKIADFGIAKLLGPGDSSDIALTGAGSTLGTPHYMAPEQIEQPGLVDHRADIYSLGVVFYEMLTGELPIGRFAAPSKKANVNEQIDAIVLRALAKERELRQQSATEIRTQVEGVSMGSGVRPPASGRTPRAGKVLKSAQAFLTTPAHLQTFRARFAHPFTAAGDLMLEPDRLVFESNGQSTLVELSTVKDVSVGQLEWWSARDHGIAILSLTYAEDGAERTIVLRPSGPWPEPVADGNRHVGDWAQAIREAVRTATAAEPATTPAAELPLPAAPKWIKYALFPAILILAPSGFIGAEVVHSGEVHRQLLVMGLGFGAIAASLAAILVALMAAFTFASTRWALERGNLHGFVWRGKPVERPEPTVQGPGSGGVGTAVGLVVFYALYIFPGSLIASLLGPSGPLISVVSAGFFAAVIGALVADRTPARPWLRGMSVMAVMMALPAIGYGLFFLIALVEEKAGWNPGPAEAVVVPLTILGMVALPWAALRLHRACRAAAAAEPAVAAMPAGNPWPRRVFYLIVCLIVLPVVLFIVALVVPYFAWRASEAQPHPTQVALKSVLIQSNLVVAHFDIWSRSGGFNLTARYEGEPLNDALIAATPTFERAVAVVPTAPGLEPAVGNRFASSLNGNRPARYSVAFVLPDGESARRAAAEIQKNFTELRQGGVQVRRDVFLFRLNEGRFETSGTLRFAEDRRLWCVGEIRPHAPMPAVSRIREPEARPVEVVDVARRLVGTWEFGLPLGTATMTLAEDGTLVVNVSLLAKQLTNAGKWRLEAGKFVTEITESTDEEQIGKIEHASIVTVTDEVLVIRNLKEDGTSRLTNLRRVRAQFKPEGK